MFNYSDNELDFFRTLIYDHEIRIDGRTKLSIREHEVFYNVIPTCLSSLKLVYNDNQKEILFAVKGEIVNKANINSEKLISLSVDSMYKIEDVKMKKELENHIETLLLAKINFDDFKINKNSDEYYWKIYIDIYIFDTLKLSLLQMLIIGTKILIKSIKLPKMVIFTNEITGNKEFDLIEVYEDVSEREKEYTMDLKIPEVYLFAILNDSIYLDPNEEEFSIATSIVIISSFQGKIINVQSIGSSVDIHKIQEISSIISLLDK
jgi:exosome complex RNA-binding protein Rrp42 (RNase PH superfamily)